MREIKFRVWDYEKMTTDLSILDLYKYRGGWDRIEIMQYTGRKDKNGKEIYEGDIVEGLVMFQDNLIKVKGVIKFVHGRFVIAKYNCSLYEFANIPSKKSNEIEVIGNKYENFELKGGE